MASGQQTVRGGLVFLLFLVLPAGTQADEASVSERFDNAVRTFQFQDYAASKAAFQQLLYPTLSLENLEQIRDAREYLGASEWFLGEKDTARQEFTSLLIGWPEHELDPFYYPPDLVSFFESLRDELLDLKLIKPKPKPEPEVSGKDTVILEKETVIVQNPLLPWIPFGVGQYVNGDTSLGTVFLVLETGLLATAITSYYLIVDRAATSSDQGRPLYATFWASQGLFLGLAATGIAEAHFRFQERTTTIERNEIEQGESGSLGGAPLIEQTEDGWQVGFRLFGSF